MTNFIYALCLTLLISDCSNKNLSLEGKSIFRYNEHANISSLDPAYARSPNNIWIVNQIFNGLVQLDDSLHVVPDIAKFWKVSDHGKKYTFFLKKDVMYHKHILFGKDSTRYVIAEDFKYSFNRLLDPNIASSGRWVFNDVSHFEAVNDSIFSISLKKPFPGFLGLLTTKYCSVVPKEIVNTYKTEFSKHPIGTGSFYFKLWKKNIKLVLLKNKNYHEYDSFGTQLPYLDAINVLFLPDKQSEFLEFVKGNIDMISGLDVSYKDELLTSDGKLQEKYKAKVQLLTSPYLNTEYIGLYMEDKKDELRSVNFRKAINYSFDRQKVITYLRNGLGTPAVYGMIPKGMPGSSPSPFFEYNPQKARLLLDKYIKKSGNINPALTISTNANYLDICEYLQNKLQRIGIKTKIDLINPSVLKQAKSSGKLEAFRASWIADYPEAETYMSMFYSKNFSPNGPNYTHFSNPDFDALYESSFQETEPSKRIILYQKMDSLVMRLSPVIPIYYDNVVRFVSNKVKGMTINPINLLQLKNCKKIKEIDTLSFKFN